MIAWVLAVGISGLTSHYCIAQAMRLADATVVAPLDFLRLPLIAVVGYLFYDEPLTFFVLAGAVLVVAGNMVNVLAERRLFVTLDPSSRRLKFPRDIDVIITDTVGFIRDLPQDLMVAFRATLEELENADLLLHVIDISNPQYENQVKAVDKILTELNLHHMPCIRVLNKMDLIDDAAIDQFCKKLNALAISAKTRATLIPLIEKMQDMIEPMIKIN